MIKPSSGITSVLLRKYQKLLKLSQPTIACVSFPLPQKFLSGGLILYQRFIPWWSCQITVRGLYGLVHYLVSFHFPKGTLGEVQKQSWSWHWATAFTPSFLSLVHLPWGYSFSRAGELSEEMTWKDKRNKDSGYPGLHPF